MTLILNDIASSEFLWLDPVPDLSRTLNHHSQGIR